MDVGPCVTLAIWILTLTWPLVFHIQGMWCQAYFIPCAPSCWHPGSPIPYLRLSWGWLHLFAPRTFEAPVPHAHRPYQSMPSLATCSYCVFLQTVLSYAEGGAHCTNEIALCTLPTVLTGESVWTAGHMQWLQPTKWVEDVLYWYYQILIVKYTWSTNYYSHFPAYAGKSCVCDCLQWNLATALVWQWPEAGIHRWYNGWMHPHG